MELQEYSLELKFDGILTACENFIAQVGNDLLEDVVEQRLEGTLGLIINARKLDLNISYKYKNLHYTMIILYRVLLILDHKSIYPNETTYRKSSCTPIYVTKEGLMIDYHPNLLPQGSENLNIARQRRKCPRMLICILARFCEEEDM